MKKIVFPIIIALIIASLCVTTASADVGNVFDDIGGGYDFGGGDYDFGGSDVGFPGVFIFSDAGEDVGSASQIITILIFIVVLVIVARIFKKGVASTSGGISQRTQAASEQTVIDAIRTVDSDFSPEQFKTYASDVFIRVQEAWESKDWKVIRPFESDQLFMLHQNQLNELIKDKKTNYLNGQNIKSVTLADFRVGEKNEILTVKLNAGLLDFILDDETGKLLAGSRTERQDRNYYLEFIRTKGTKTQSGGNLRSDNCPSCGAPIEVNAGGYCEYCGSIITSGTYGWVLNVYTKW